MKFVTVTELNRGATRIVSEIETTGEEVVITKNGKPVILMRLVSDSDFGSKETEKKRKMVKAK